MAFDSIITAVQEGSVDIGAFPDAEVYCLSMRDQEMQNDICKENFIISEKQMVKRLLGKGKVGKREVANSCNEVNSQDIYDNTKVKSRILL